MPTTTNYGWTDPTVGGSSGTWGSTLNAMADDIDADVKTVQDTSDAALPKAGGTMTGNVTTFTSAATRVDKGSVSGTVNFDLTTANAFTLTISGAATLAAPTGATTGTVANWMVWRMTNGGAATLTWNSAYKFPGGTKPTFTAAGKDDLAWLSWDNGTTWELAGYALDVK